MRRWQAKILAWMSAGTVAVASVYPVMGQEEHGAPAAAQATAATPGQASAQAAAPASVVCVSDPTVIDDLKKRREEIDSAKKELASKESELKAREQALNEELKKLELARDEISQIDASRKKENEERVSKLVETIQSMSPKAGALLLAELDESLAVSAIYRMDTPKLAKIMSKMEPGKSSRLSEIMAGVVRAKRGSARTSNDVPATTLSSAKGGDRNNGQNEHNDQRSGQSQQSAQQPAQREPGSAEKIQGKR